MAVRPIWLLLFKSIFVKDLSGFGEIGIFARARISARSVAASV